MDEDLSTGTPARVGHPAPDGKGGIRVCQADAARLELPDSAWQRYDSR
jgi:hypothetical protein